MTRILKTVHFEAVQVVRLLDDGRLAEWWPGDKVATLKEARANAVRLRKEFPLAKYEVIRVTVDQMPVALPKIAAEVSA